MRIRSIKPEFWRSQAVADLPRDIRLLWIGLWSYVDDNGVGIDDYRQIAADLFALDEDPIEARNFVRDGLATLSRVFRITRYRVAGRSYLYVNGWEEHQKIDKPGKARYPLPSESDEPVTSTEEPEEPAFATPSRDSRDSLGPGTGEQGNRGTGEQGEKTRSSEMSKSEPNRFDEFWQTYPKRVGKQAAIKAWRKALKLTDPDTIIDGARRYAASRSGEDPKYTAHPSTWLNAGRWDDEPQSRYVPQPERSTADQRIAQLQAMKGQLRETPEDCEPSNVRALTGRRTA